MPKLKRHVESVHKRSILYQCDKCGKTSYSAESMRSHKKTHIEIKPTIQCDVCYKLFKCKANLTAHKKWSHEGLKKTKECEKCHKMFFSNNHLLRHIEGVHDKVKNFSCDSCRKSFFTSSHLRRHQVTHDLPYFIKVEIME